ncbi:MAG: hypothetical protein ACRDTD_26525, partial [Pseudonocardiaceae bacterium]
MPDGTPDVSDPGTPPPALRLVRNDTPDVPDELPRDPSNEIEPAPHLLHHEEIGATYNPTAGVPEGWDEATRLQNWDDYYNAPGVENSEILLGGGPRSASDVIAESLWLEQHADDINALRQYGREPDVVTHVIGQRSETGEGNAWGRDHGPATANTGIEGQLGLNEAIPDFLREEGDRLLHDYESNENPAAAALIRSSRDGTGESVPGQPVLVRASGTRADLGDQFKAHYNSVRD